GIVRQISHKVPLSLFFPDNNGTLDDKTPLAELEKHLKLQGEDGYRLVSAIPQVYEGSTESTVLIFELEYEDEV
ncbi:hypothetical protein P9C02_20770, partial [Bacillus paralicheniformis]